MAQNEAKPINRRQRLGRLGSLFRGPGRIPDDPFVFLTTESLMRGLPAYIGSEDFSLLVADVACHVYEFKDLHVVQAKTRADGEQFLSVIVSCMATGEPMELSAAQLTSDAIPEALRGPVRVLPRAGLNVAALTAEGQTEDRFYLLWTHTSNQTTDAAILLLDLQEQTAFLQPSIPAMAYADLYTIMKFSVPQATWPRAEARSAWLRALAPAAELALVPLPCPTHFGHYIQNNLCHLSRLEELGVTGHCAMVYRPGPYDYFNSEEEASFFLPGTQAKMQPVPSINEAKAYAIERGQALISSKGATLSRHIATCLQQSLEQQHDNKDKILSEDTYQLCVGIRGGSREALNLVAVMEQVLQGLLDRQSKPVHLIVDGMSQSRLNSMDTTRFLSLEREQELTQQLCKLAEQHPRLTVQPVVNLPMFDQMQAIARCNACISHFGSSFFKYMVMAGRPVIVHGDRPAFADKYADTPPPNYFLGPDYVTQFGAGPDPKRACYELNIDTVVPALLEILLRH